MANPPFSGDPLDLPINATDYVNNINDNFGRCRDEILDLHSRVQSLSGNSNFNPFLQDGQLEVNGHFQVHRRLHEVARTLVIPADGPQQHNAAWTALPAGTGLGITGAGIYSYHPTICPGWYAPKEIMPASLGASADAFGEPPASGGLGLQINLPAAARLNGTNDESVIFQPISMHSDPSKWAGKSIKIQIEYEHDGAIGSEPELYAAWNVTGSRTFANPIFGEPTAELPVTGLGTTNIVSIDVTPDAAATMFEVGVRFRDAGAHSFVIRKFIVSNNPQRDITTDEPSMLRTDMLLVDNLYYRPVFGEDVVDYVTAGGGFTAGLIAGKQWTPDDKRPVIRVGDRASALSLWDAANATLYATPILVTANHPFSGGTWARITDGVTADMTEVFATLSGTIYDDHRGDAHLRCLLEIATIPLSLVGQTDLGVRYEGEWITTFKPLLLP